MSKNDIEDLVIGLVSACLAIALFLYWEEVRAADLPDHSLTPGVVRAVTVHDLCTTSTKAVRHTAEATKRVVYAEYDRAPRIDPTCTGPAHSCYEIDHLISLEIGGADEQANLWPQLYDGEWSAHDKDKLENELHRRICVGKMNLKDAQNCIAENWVDCYEAVFHEQH